MKFSITVIVFFSFLKPSYLLASENWPQWRGPDASAVVTAGIYPESISAENIAWKVEIPGRGCSTPAVWGDQIFVTCGIDDRDGVVCYDFIGQEQWRHQFGPERPGKHMNGSGSNSSPTTDGEHLVVYYKSGTLASLDLTGKVLWETNLQEAYGEDTLWWDLGTSPVLADGLVIVAVMNDGDGFLVALDLKTGKEVWKQDRIYEVPKECDNSYTTPALTTDGKVIVTLGADHVTGHDVRTGKLLWECGGLNPSGEAAQRTIASQTLAGDIVVVPYRRGEMLTAIQLGGQGDITEKGKFWDRPAKAGDVPTPLVTDGKVIVLSDRGDLTCLDVSSGDELWTAELPRGRAKYFSSPVLANGLLFTLREDGMLYFGRIADGYEHLGEYNFDEQCVATPIPIRDQLLVRGSEHLFLVRQ
ncbi:outer membrane protein assembly factor BamB family protein [Bythopirellula polymerisocia]|uniref:Outer membrane protein assembly factor BamB n=1 Tax=Bythopirellula polymerisocia TaxID=2528003 RepID=A0A5C6CE02_9BACT|nr:PQQ-binding-like beta-propeller repeat protein [Bythopirellula polymerisocia]TWU22830.1 Outer membrane protein assembly factor BamB precursor [Bythopirellula polymerisocia]